MNLYTQIYEQKRMRTIHISAVFFFFQNLYLLRMYKYSPIETISSATFVKPTVMDQADIQACQNHHFGRCFPPPYFQVPENHYKSMTKTIKESSVSSIQMRLRPYYNKFTLT